ncbi:MAG: YigZ family protein [Rhodothermales bacterium]|nr:YigZ family protein [Rhodothermales bacterium]
MADTYRTLAAPARAEAPKVKGSRFLADAFPVATEAEAEARLHEVRAREPGATHHCWAYRLDADRFRASDDGEPTGTAGLPILRQIDGRSLRHVLVVVTRYYGGTKLGTGGLIRAYGEAAGAVLDAADVTERVERVAVRLRFAYADTAPARQALHRFDAEVAEERYAAETELLVRVRRSEVEALRAAFTDALGGRGSATVGG